MSTPVQRIVVCDNDSQDGSLARLRAWADEALETASVTHSSIAEAFAAASDDGSMITFIQTGSNLGYGGGNNVGVRYALEQLGAQYVWILNNDTVVDTGALKSLVDYAELNADVAIVGSKLLQYHARPYIQALGGGTFFPPLARDTQIGRGRRTHRLASSEIDLDHVVGASMLVRAAAMHEVGLLDETYFLYREETDWCIRMRQHGWRLSYCAGSVVWHKEGRSSGFKTVLYDYYAVRNMLHLIRKFYPHAVALAFIASLCTVMLPKLARLQFRRVDLARRAYVDFLRGVKGKSAVNPDTLILQTLHARENDE